MRTVHETEALRPSDPVPKHHSSHALKVQGSGGRIKLVFSKGANGVGDNEKSNTSTPGPNNQQADGDYDNHVTYVPGPSGNDDDWEVQYPSDIQFTEDELALPPDQLFRLLRRQLHWAQQESTSLKQSIEELEVQRKSAFFDKELVLENVLEAESVIIGIKGIPSGPDGAYVRSRIREDIKPAKLLDLQGDKPWWREEDPAKARRDQMQPKLPTDNGVMQES